MPAVFIRRFVQVTCPTSGRAGAAALVRLPRKFLFVAAFAMLANGFPSGGGVAQSGGGGVTQQIGGGSSVQDIVKIVAVENLVFPCISRPSTRAASITVSQNDGAVSRSNTDIFVACASGRAKFEVTGPGSTQYDIVFPDEIEICPLDKDGECGGALVTMKIRSFVSSVGDVISLPPEGIASFHVGATLDLPENAPIGEFKGEFSVMLQSR